MLRLNHITFSVSNLEKAIAHYNLLFDRSPVAVGRSLAYYDLDGIWFALNVVQEKRNDSYSHVAYSVDNLDVLIQRIKSSISIDEGRQRHIDEGRSIYIRDEDGNLVEFHEGTLESRLAYYQKHRDDITIME